MFKLWTRNGQRAFLEPGDRIVWYRAHDKIMILRQNDPQNSLLFADPDRTAETQELRLCTKKDFVAVICLILSGNQALDAREITDLSASRAEDLIIFEITKTS